ncbi:hypothetical protein [Alteromonas sp. a30]|uniref:hypothetical protein n=1 Tax=Alteromonas sp. a30 TaxID=2730917 RepID=UPI00227E4C06|nr:hypothetical protein [Alteromonas sp. a30]MCY7297044.1 hypothetical protein [Alteromonas sp. a30]
MSENMKIDVISIESKISEPFFAAYKSIAIESIHAFIEAIKGFEASGKKRELYSGVDNEAEEYINSYALNHLGNVEDTNIYQVLDALRHAFVSYAYNGLRQLYTRQENEGWYPRIVLTEILMPNDIDSLDEVITIYRGCGYCDFKNRKYGQAWTTSLKIAQDFAYVHYAGQDWFRKDKRTVLVTKYSRDDVLFSDQSIEFEVVVNVNKLENVQIYT